MDRRETLRTIAAAAMLPAMLPALRYLAPSELWALAERTPGVLSARQSAAVNVAAQCIIPATTTPGAGDVHVERFVDLMLAEWHTAEERERVLAGLAALDGLSEATPERRAEILGQLDTAAAGGGGDHWFARLKYLIVWGYYTSEAAQTGELGLWPLPGHYDGNASYAD
jgi:gluconate 2-dehydrogenase gamma chain